MLLLIGVDGATPELIERLTSTGQMPSLRSLMRHGVYGRLESSVNCDPCSAWSNLLTGVNPGKHGVWALRNLGPDSYQWRLANSRMLRAPGLPQMLTDRGQEVGTLFVPMTFPAREAEWTTVAGWLAPSVEAEGFAHPDRVASLARRRLSDTPHDPRLASCAGSGRYEEGVERAVSSMQQRAALALDLIGDRRWDFLAVNFTELDRVLRWYWHLIDRQHVDFRDDLYAAHGELIGDLHRRLDAQIGRLVEALAPDDHLIVVSTYGMAANSRAHLCIPDLLAHLDLLAMRSSTGGACRSLTRRVSRTLRALTSALRDVLPEPLAEMLPAPDEVRDAPAEEGDPWIDYERSWAIPTPGGHLYLNHEDEFPFGIVTNGISDRLMLQIMSSLQTAIDPATGRRPLQWARPREEVCSGPYVNRLPHLVTRWDQTCPVMGLTATGRDGRVQVARPAGGRVPSGAPSAHGVLIAAGAGIRRGARIEGARVVDVAATIMHLRGERVPSYFDGAVLEQALTDRMLQEVPVRTLQRELPRMIEAPERIQAASDAVRSGLESSGYEL